VGLLEGDVSGLEVYADSAYGSGDTRAAIRNLGHDLVIKPIPLRTAIAGGFNRDDFIVDHHGRIVTCPAGHTAAISTKGWARFETHCRNCPLSARCTTSKTGKAVKISEHDDELVYARQSWHDPVVTDHYQQHRPMVERTIAWLVARGHRRVRYRGVERNQIWLAHRLAAINLRRLLNLGLSHTTQGWALV
jgi:hypothetical protein